MRLPTPLLALALAALTSTAQAQATDSTQSGQPPKVVKHTVKKGDTLWDIAQFYLQDPFRWPEVFHANTDIIKNPHWIYPGQILTIEGSAVRPDVAAQVGNDGFIAPRPARPTGSTVFLGNAPLPVPPNTGPMARPASFTVRQGEYAAAPYVVDLKLPLGSGFIVGAVERTARGLSANSGYRLFDRIYVTAPAKTNPQPGEELLLARQRDVIADVGKIIVPTGVVRIDSLGEKGILIGTIVQQYRDIYQDELTIPYDASFVPTTTRPTPGTYPVTGKVLWIPNQTILPTLQSYVIVHATTSQGVKTGDQFTIYDEPVAAVKGKAHPTATATVQIVRVTPYAATGIIVNQSQPTVAEGMMARQTAKMP
jgi:hypothetical protein